MPALVLVGVGWLVGSVFGVGQLWALVRGLVTPPATAGA
jgi:hypothetical protein